MCPGGIRETSDSGNLYLNLCCLALATLATLITTFAIGPLLAGIFGPFIIFCLCVYFCQYNQRIGKGENVSKSQLSLPELEQERRKMRKIPTISEILDQPPTAYQERRKNPTISEILEQPPPSYHELHRYEIDCGHPQLTAAETTASIHLTRQRELVN